MVLHHLHIHQWSASAIRKRHSVASANKRVGARLEHAAQSTGGHDDGFGSDDVYFSTPDFHEHRATALTFLDYEREHEPFFVHPHSRFENLLVQYV